MPPLIFAVVCWIAGAFAGSAERLAFVPLAVLVAGSIGVSLILSVAASRNALVAAGPSPFRHTFFLFACVLSALSVASIVAAREHAHKQQFCRMQLTAALNAGQNARIVLDDHVAPRGSSRGILTGDTTWRDCTVPVSARIASGRATPGQWLRVNGRATVTDRGVRVDGAIEALNPAHSDWRRRVRGRTGDVIDRDFGNHASLVRALLIADQDGIAPSVRDTYANAGLVHLLSVSGLHVAIIAGSLLTLAKAIRLSRTAAFVLSLIVIVVYVAILGAPAPAIRSAVMLAVVGLSEQWQRPTHPWTALALGAVLPTLQPGVVLDLGYQLSVSGMAALVAARALLRRSRQIDVLACPRRLRPLLQRLRTMNGWRYGLWRECVTGTVATIVTAPLIAWTFGRLSVIAPLSNIVAGPLVAFLQPALFLSLLLSPWPTLSQWVANASVLPITLLDIVAQYAARVPYASIVFTPTALGATCAGVAAAAFVWATGSRRWMPGLMLAGVALTVAVWSPALLHGSGNMELHVLDVGQGDALAIRTPKGRWILVDAGVRWKGGDSGRRTVIPYIQSYGGAVAAFVLSHAHDDHVGGAASIVTALRPVRWWEPAFVTRSEAYLAALHAVQKTGGQWHRANPSDTWSLDGIDIQVLAPDSMWTAHQTDANETSVVLRVQYGSVAFILTGDAEAAEESWIVANTPPSLLRADVLKLGHHGSKTSSTSAFLDAVQPRIGVVSVGAGNRYGHPSPETLEALIDREVPLLRTDLEGTIIVITNGKSLTVRVGRETWEVPSAQ